MRYTIELINSEKNGQNYRITDTIGDNRVATCFLEEHAELVCAALNAFENSKQKSA